MLIDPSRELNIAYVKRLYCYSRKDNSKRLQVQHYTKCLQSLLTTHCLDVTRTCRPCYPKSIASACACQQSFAYHRQRGLPRQPARLTRPRLQCSVKVGVVVRVKAWAQLKPRAWLVVLLRSLLLLVDRQIQHALL